MNLFSVVQNASRERLQSFLKLKSVDFAEPPANRFVFGHDLAMIMISTPATSLVFKTHFSPISLIPAVAKFTGQAVHQVSGKNSVDLMKEFCNLTGGAIKIYFESTGLGAGFSLPIHTRGFDEVFFAPANEKTRFCKSWSLLTADWQLICSCSIQVLDDGKFGNLKLVEKETFDSNGDVEFL